MLENVTDAVCRRLKNEGLDQGDGIRALQVLQAVHRTGDNVHLLMQFKQFVHLKQAGKHADAADYVFAFNEHLTHFKNDKQQVNPMLATMLFTEGMHERFSDLRKQVCDAAAKKLPTLPEVQELLKNREAHAKVRFTPADRGGNVFQQSRNSGHSSKEGPTKIDMKTTKKVFDCYNCKQRHAGGEHQCEKPCKMCGSSEHTRHKCPERKRNTLRNSQARSANSAEESKHEESASEDVFADWADLNDQPPIDWGLAASADMEGASQAGGQTKTMLDGGAGWHFIDVGRCSFGPT